MHSPVGKPFKAATAYTSYRDTPVYLNETDRFLTREGLTVATLTKEIEAFYDKVYRSVVEMLLQTSPQLGSIGQPIINAFQGSEYLGADGYKVCTGYRIAFAQLPVPPLERFGCSVDSNRYQVAQFILGLSTEDQRALLIDCIGTSIKTLQQVLPPHRARQWLCPDLVTLSSSIANSNVFIAELASRADDERSYYLDRDQPRSHGRTLLYDALLCYLADRLVILRPYQSKVFHHASAAIEEWLLTDSTIRNWKSVLEIFTAHRDIKTKRRYDSLVTGLRSDFLALVCCSTVRRSNDLSIDLFGEYIAGLRQDTDSTRQMRHVLAVYSGLRSTATEREQVPKFTYRKKREYTGRFPWVYISYTEKTKSLYPQSGMENYTPRTNIEKWAEVFNHILPRLETKTISTWHTAMNNFLAWLYISGVSAQSLEQLSRFDINDGHAVEKSRCFRAYLISLNNTPQYTTTLLSRIANVFDMIIYEQSLDISNPVSIKFDTLKERTRRAKTPRHALSREMLEFIRDLNARDDFAFSRSRPAHRRPLRNPATGDIELVWFPAVAICLDFLLRVPVRGFQARHLDSGEGDEFSVDPTAVMKPVRNRLRTATKARAEGVLSAIPSLGEDTILGLYINTNKTGVDQIEGYEIPWCDDALAKNITMMKDWQMQFNPISAPVLCVERGKGSENPEVLRAIKKAYPLFRDPSDPENRPISRDMLSRYWDDIMYQAELELGAKRGRPILLTEFVTLNKANHKTERRHISRFDIHTLRVSGITALIEAGLPPSMVMDVAGHSTVVMTMYYNKTSASALNAKLSAIMRKTSCDLDGVDLRDEDLEGVSAYLINTRLERDQAGRRMLSEACGKGDGGVEIMAHGVCPGGECATGGPYIASDTEYAAVPRPLACSLCRYRLTGPMFLPGLVANANRLLFELRRKGQEIASLLAEVRNGKEKATDIALKRSRVKSLYRETDIICEEWGAEIVYVRLAESMITQYLESTEFDMTDVDLPIVSGEQRDAVRCRLEQKSEFALLQSIVESCGSWHGFKCELATIEHREVLNEILSANDIDPFLLRLSGPARDAAARLLGRAITRLVPDEEIGGLRKPDSLDRYKAVGIVLNEAASIALAQGKRASSGLALLDFLSGEP